MHALVAEAMKKAAIVWLAAAGRPAYPVWCMPIGDALYVVTGGDEQPAPDLTAAERVTVTARGDHGGRIVSWPAAVARVTPDDDSWSEVATLLAGKRLNASGPVDALVAQWATTSVVIRLAPIDDEAETGADASTGSGAAVPLQTPAATRVAKPFRLHRVKRR
jgi:hypothetical protein